MSRPVPEDDGAPPAPVPRLGKRSGIFLSLLLLLLDGGLIAVSLLLCIALLAPAEDRCSFVAQGIDPLLLLAGGIPLPLLVLAGFGHYHFDPSQEGWRRVVQSAGAILGIALLVLLVVLGLGARLVVPWPSPLFTTGFMLWLLVVLGAHRGGFSLIARRLWRRRWFLRRTLLVGEAAAVKQLEARLSACPQSGYQVIDRFVVPDDASPQPIEPCVDPSRPSVEPLRAILAQRRPQTLLLVAAQKWLPSLLPLLLEAIERGAEIQLVQPPSNKNPLASESSFSYSWRRTGRVCGWPSCALTRPPLFWLKRLAKRLMDLLLASMGLLICWPLLLLFGALIRRHDGGPALFLQRRIGKNERPFIMIKLRTMYRDPPPSPLPNIAEGPLTKIPNDPRVTPLGRWLRRHKLDELPQLLNVVAGQMSLVGPRPPTPTEVQDYQAWQKTRLAASPGLTGLWQIHKERKWRFAEMIALDLHYILQWSLLLDIQVLLRTIRVVIRGN